MNHGHITATSVRVDEDEGRIVLLIDSDEDDTITVNIHGCALEFYAEVKRELGPYAQEAEMARAAVKAGSSLSEYLTGQPEPQADGYDLSDPKHPTYHERMVD